MEKENGNRQFKSIVKLTSRKKKVATVILAVYCPLLRSK